MSLVPVICTWPGKGEAHTEWFPVCLVLLLFCLMVWCSNYHTHTHTRLRACTWMYTSADTHVWIHAHIHMKHTHMHHVQNYNKCTHTHTHTHIYIYIYIYIYAHMHASPLLSHVPTKEISLSLSLSHTHTHTHPFMQSPMHALMHTHTHTHMHACTPARTHTRMPAHAQAHIVIPDFCEMWAMHHRLLQLKQAELWLQDLDRRVQSLLNGNYLNTLAVKCCSELTPLHSKLVQGWIHCHHFVNRIHICYVSK